MIRQDELQEQETNETDGNNNINRSHRKPKRAHDDPPGEKEYYGYHNEIQENPYRKFLSKKPR